MENRKLCKVTENQILIVCGILLSEAYRLNPEPEGNGKLIDYETSTKVSLVEIKKALQTSTITKDATDEEILEAIKQSLFFGYYQDELGILKSISGVFTKITLIRNEFLQNRVGLG